MNYPKDKVVLFLPDAHGLLLVNNKVRHAISTWHWRS
jgi:hypothetical protein